MSNNGSSLVLKHTHINKTGDRATEDILYSISYTPHCEYLRDTVIHLKPDTSLIRALIECDSVGRARLTEISALSRSASLTQSLNLDDQGTLTATAAIDSMGIYLTYKDSLSNEKIIKEFCGANVVQFRRGDSAGLASQARLFPH